MPWIVCGVLAIAVVILCVQLHKKIVIDKTEAVVYQNKVDELTETYDNLNRTIITLNDQIQAKQDEYRNRTSALTKEYLTDKEAMKRSLDNDAKELLAEQQKNLEEEYQRQIKSYQNQLNQWAFAASQIIEEERAKANQITEDTKFLQERYAGLLEPLKQYEKDQQQRLFYTIQVPEEYRQDIDFLLNTVSQKVQHPDVINKLVWTEYVRPYITDTFKRVGVQDAPGIYKLTNIESGKAYIGKSTNVKGRITDHFKSSVGCSTIADQAVHHAILQTGFWNWTIEVITYCEKDKLSELEKYYIEFFKTQEFGYNKREGG